MSEGLRSQIHGQEIIW